MSYEFVPADRALLLRVGKVLRAAAKKDLEAAPSASTPVERRSMQERAGRLQGDLHELDRLRLRLEASQVAPRTGQAEA